MPGPILFCYDGSDDSREALRAAAEVLDSTKEAVVLTVWESTATVLARSAPFGPVSIGDSAEAEADSVESDHALAAAKEGAERARGSGWEISERVEQSEDGLAERILAIAEELDASLIVCGSRGRGPVRSALLGSVSHALVTRAGRPVLVSPNR